MMLEQFQVWSRTASAAGRAEGVTILAKAVLRGGLDRAARGDAVAMLTGFLDDPSPLVRIALAEAIASDPDAPHHLILALAEDQPAVAAIVLARSDVLSDAELIDCAGAAPPAAQAAIAGRRELSAAVAAALAEVAAPQALVALADNRGARLLPAAMRRMTERCGDHAPLREALLQRGELPGDVRMALVAATARALGAFVGERGWLADGRMERIILEARDRANVTIGAGATAAEGIALASHLRENGQLTIGLAFRIILSGERPLFAAILRDLTGAAPARIEALLGNCGSAAFAALYHGAGLPAELLPAFRAAVRIGATIAPSHGRALSLPAIEQLIASCEELGDAALAPVIVMLRRFEAEAARDEARWRRLAAAPMDGAVSEPILLRDAGDPPGSVAAGGGARHRYTIDLAAIEAELCVA